MTALIITGGYLDIGWAGNFLETIQYDWVIAADRGLRYCRELGIVPDCCVGDFDSLEGGPEAVKTLFDGSVILYPSEKDDTDTQLALECAANRRADRVILIGATGSRLDHVMANLGNIVHYLGKGITVRIYDKNNCIYAIDKECFFRREDMYGDYLSVIPWQGDLTGVTYTGFKYNTSNGLIPAGSSLGVSNQLAEPQGSITVESGVAIIFETRD